MTVRVASAADRVARVIENPLSGERIVIPKLPPDRRSRLSWELYLAPGGRVPSSHVHPGQAEVFRVVSGRVRFRLGARRIVAGPGDTVRVPAHTVHHFANASPEEAHISVETEPALDIVGMLEMAASLAQDQYATGHAFPHPFDLALFMRDFDAEVQAPYVPAWLVRAFARPVAWSVRKLGWDARYRRLRETPGRGDGPARQAFS